MEWAMKNNPREEDAFLEENILPIMQSGRLSLVDEECELFEGFSVRIYYGHTPGLMIPVIRYHDKTLIYTGDLIPTVAHLPLIWNMSYDVESLKRLMKRAICLKKSLRMATSLYSSTMKSIECCTLEMTPRASVPKINQICGDWLMRI